MSILLHLAFGKPSDWLWQSPLNFGQPIPGIGFHLGVVYVVWIIGVLILYPVCRAFADLKQSRRDWWLSYL